MRICGIRRDDGGCGFYRIESPIRMAALLDKDTQAEIVKPGDPESVVAGKMDADVVVIARPNSESFFKKIEGLQALGKKVVVDHDDNVFQVSPFSPHYQELGTEEVEYTFEDGRKVQIWSDIRNTKGGKRIDLEGNRTRLQWLKRCVQQADAVSVTVPELGSVFYEYNQNVLVLPNCLNLRHWERPEFLKKEFRIAWHGGYSHYEDLFILKDVLPVIAKAHENIKFVMLGYMWEALLKEIPEDRFEFHPWVPTMAYPYKMAMLNADMAVIPLADSAFNRCKSQLKWLEYSALKVPCVTSNVHPYIDIYNGKNGIFCDNDKASWIKGIATMIKDETLRREMAESAYNTVAQDFDINTQYHRWVKAYRGLLN